MLILAGILISPPAFSQETNTIPLRAGTGSFDLGPDGDPFADPIEIRREIECGEKVDSILSEQFEPLHKLWDPFANKLAEQRLEVTFQYITVIQHSDDLVPNIGDSISGAQNTLSGGDADLFVKWNVYKPGDEWAGHVRLSGEYRHGFNKVPAAGMTYQVGSIWPTLRGWNKYTGVALPEAYWHQGTLKSPFEYRIGRVKNTTVWNGGKYIGGNDGMVGGQISGTPALIVLNSGWSLNTVYHPVDGTTHIAAGVFQANVSNEDFNKLRSDELIYALQMGWKPKLQNGSGRYHIFTWHVDETDITTSANGFAVNAEQDFGHWTPFFRYSFGDQDRSDSKSHPIRQSANIGIGYNGIFGRKTDWVAVVASWAEPTDDSLRDQYGLEADYKFRLTPHTLLTPHIEWIRDPSRNPDKNNVLVCGLRAKIEF